MRDILSDARTLWILLAAAVLMTVGFSVVADTFQFSILDELYDAEEIRARLAVMTPDQKQAHRWMTGTLDVLYPLVYGAFFIGMALRFLGRFGPLLALPGIVVIPVDLAEGVVQILLLNGHEDVVGWKEVLTPIKLALFFLALLVCLIGLSIRFFQRLRRQQIPVENRL